MNTTELTLKRGLLALTEEEHLTVATKAKNLIIKKAGKEPERDTFENEHVPRYPPLMNKILLFLMAIPLFLSFLVSAFRLYDVGYNTYFHSIQDQFQATIAGITIVLVAEIGMILFSIFPTVFPEKDREQDYGTGVIADLRKGIANLPRPNPYSAYVLLCLIVTLVGNIHVAEPQALASVNGNYFGYIEAVVPTLVVIGIAWGLKRMILHYLAERQRVTKLYKEALAEWKAVTNHPEQSAEYDLQLRKGILKKVKEKNARTKERKELLAALQPMHEQWLLWRELQRDQIALTGVVEPFPHELPPLPQFDDPAEVVTDEPFFIQPQVTGKGYQNGVTKTDGS